jgi:hypothetical protein
MPDATNIPTNSMVHYPKALLAEIWQSFQRHPGLPSLNLIKHLTDHFNRFLTAHAMAKYVLDRARANKARRVLFIDETLTLGGAYSSVMTLVGLLQIDELEVSTLQSVEHIWSDWKGNSSSFYGRGFGYCGVLDPSLRIRQRSMKVNAAVELLRREYFDLVIFPTIARNNRLYGHFRRCINPQSTVLIHEEDLPPTPAALEELRQSQAVVFVRSLT